MSDKPIAVIDIGKTNVKLALVRLSDLSEIAVMTRPNRVLPGPPYPHFDVSGHWAFLLDGLAQCHAEHGISAITATTHGAAAALLAEDGSLAAPVLDYEHAGPDASAAAYGAIRPPFSETGSPRLTMGLNLGAQLHWQFETDPTLRAKVHQIVTYPQFWGYLLTGVPATDVTSLGCHTDLWNPYQGQVSTLAATLGITGVIAPPRKPGDVLGSVAPAVAQHTGLSPDTTVHCGIHDSNASLVPHLLARKPPFSVVSTGTWMVAMAVRGKPVTLDPARDTLVNVNAFGDAVPSARFMAGREQDMALDGRYVQADDRQIRDVLRARAMLLPALVPETGPFAGRTARWRREEPVLGSAQRSVAVGFYLALVTAQCLELVGHDGPVIVEGPFAGNKPFLWMLGAAASAPVIPMDSRTGTSQGAALLTGGQCMTAPLEIVLPACDQQTSDLLSAYAAEWKHAVHEA